MNWSFGLLDAVDILLVTLFVYAVLRLIKGTRAEQMLLGLLVLVAIYGLASFFGLLTLEWVFDQFFSVFMVILVILFQSEIRSGLMRMARNPMQLHSGARLELVNALVGSAKILVERGWGGLIVIERTTGLRQVCVTGVEMDAKVDSDLIAALFCPAAPMHDGAVVVRLNERGGRIVAARVLLPLAQARAISGSFGTRHRAAVGVTEESDALVMVISEERRDIHLVAEGSMTGALSTDQLRYRLTKALTLEAELLDDRSWRYRIAHLWGVD
ncbi:MAG: diadenylate cyclase [Mariprofundales bacterium]|nr:diadenylate cyclase [Mariprofundales bacterium]